MVKIRELVIEEVKKCVKKRYTLLEEELTALCPYTGSEWIELYLGQKELHEVDDKET